MLDQSSQHEAEEAHALALSPREREVLGLAAHGLTNQQIATALAVTTHGVKFHLASIFRKLGVGNRTAAVAIYLSDHGLQSE